MTKKQWTTGSGQVINVEDMTDEHLWNTRRMLQRRGRPIYEEIKRRGTKNLKSIELRPGKKEFVPFTWEDICTAIQEAVANDVVPYIMTFNYSQYSHVVFHLQTRIIEEFGHLTNRFLWNDHFNDDTIVMSDSLEEKAKRYLWVRKHPKPEENKEKVMSAKCKPFEWADFSAAIEAANKSGITNPTHLTVNLDQYQQISDEIFGGVADLLHRSLCYRRECIKHYDSVDDESILVRDNDSGTDAGWLWRRDRDKKEEKPVPKEHLSAAQAREISYRALNEVMKDVINSIIEAAEKGETNCLVTLKPHTISALWQELTFLGYGLREEVANQTLRISWEKNKED